MSAAADPVNQADEDIQGIPEVFLHYLNDSIHTDVEFSVRCGEEWVSLSAHKLVLSLWSPVFADRFSNPQTFMGNAIEISDITPSAFDAMLKFMYGSVCDLYQRQSDVNFILKTFKAAVQYEVEALSTICRQIFTTMTPNKNNVFQLLDASVMIGSENMQQRCYKVLQTQTAAVLSSQELCNVTPAMIMIILNLPYVSFSSEYELVTWVFAWTKNEFVKTTNDRSFRSILDDVLPFLDLTKLTANEFAKLVENNPNIISEREAFSFFMNIAGCKHQLPDWASTQITRVYNFSG